VNAGEAKAHAAAYEPDAWKPAAAAASAMANHMVISPEKKAARRNDAHGETTHTARAMGDHKRRACRKVYRVENPKKNQTCVSARAGVYDIQK
jgi:hypothetical protein